MPKPPNDFEIATHGNLDSLVRLWAAEFGWKGGVDWDEADKDMLETEEMGYTVNDPGRGAVSLEEMGLGNGVVAFDYHLPEFARQIYSEIEAAIDGHVRDRDRRAGKHRGLILGG